MNSHGSKTRQDISDSSRHLLDSFSRLDLNDARCWLKLPRENIATCEKWIRVVSHYFPDRVSNYVRKLLRFAINFWTLKRSSLWTSEFSDEVLNLVWFEEKLLKKRRIYKIRTAEWASSNMKWRLLEVEKLKLEKVENRKVVVVETKCQGDIVHTSFTATTSESFFNSACLWLRNAWSWNIKKISITTCSSEALETCRAGSYCRHERWLGFRIWEDFSNRLWKLFIKLLMHTDMSGTVSVF